MKDSQLTVTTEYDGIKGTLYKLNNSDNYYYYFRCRNKVYRSSTRTDDISKSRLFLSDKIHDVYHGRSGGEVRSKSPKKEKKFSQLFEEYIENRRNSPLRVSERTIKNWKSIQPRILDFFGNWTETDFNRYSNKISLWREYQDWRRDYWKGKENERITYKDRFGNTKLGRHKNFNQCFISMNKEITLVIQILRYYKRNNELFKDMIIPNFSIQDGVKVLGKPRLIYPTPEQYTKIKEYFKDEPVKLLYFRFLGNCGVRPSESIRIKLGDIDFKNNVMMIKGRKSRYNKSFNTPFPMVGKFETIVKDVIKETSKFRKHKDTKSEEYKNDFLFIRDNGEPYKGLSSLHQYLKDSIKVMNISNKQISLNSFRHYFVIKMCKQSEMSLYYLSQMLGHKSTQTLQLVYSDYITYESVKIMKRVYKQIEEKKKSYKEMGLE